MMQILEFNIPQNVRNKNPIWNYCCHWFFFFVGNMLIFLLTYNCSIPFLFKDDKCKLCGVGLASILGRLVFVPVAVGGHQLGASLVGTAAHSLLYSTHKTWSSFYHLKPACVDCQLVPGSDLIPHSQMGGTGAITQKEKLIPLSLSRVVEAGFWICHRDRLNFTTEAWRCTVDWF